MRPVRNLSDLADMDEFWAFWTKPVNGKPSLKDLEEVPGAPWRSSKAVSDVSLRNNLKGTMSKIKRIVDKVSF